jgi:hypothetical protein
METVYVPPYFALLFMLPLGIGFYIFNKTNNLPLSMFVYFILQVSLATAARMIYG